MGEKEIQQRVRAMGGMDERWAADPAGADRIVNMYMGPDGAWRTAGGFENAFTPEAQFGPVFSIHWFSQHQGGRQWVIYERQTGSTLRLEYANFPGDGGTLIQSGRTLVNGPWPGTTYIENANFVYLFNGYDAPVRWNGKELVEVGFSIIPPPPRLSTSSHDAADANFSLAKATLAGPFQRGVGLASADTQRWSYGYAITWVNDLGMESPPSPTVFLEDENPGVPGGSATILGLLSVLVHIPEAPSNVRGIRVYRTANVVDLSTVGQQGNALYFHSEYAAGEVSFNDDTPDSELGLQFNPDSVGLFPPGARYAQVFKGTLFVDAGPELPSRIRYSSPLFVEQMPEINFIQVGDATTGPIMGFKSTKNALVVFKERGIYLIRGNPTAGFRSDTLTEDVGCAAPRSIIEIPGMGTMFVSNEGPYVLIGALENTGTPTRVEFIGGSIAKVWRTEVSKKALKACRAVRYLKDREIWLQVPASGDDRARLGLIFHYTVNGWSVREDFPFSCLAEGRDHRGLLFAGSWDDTNHPGIHVYSRGFDLDGNNLSSRYETTWQDLEQRTQVKHVQTMALNVGRALTFEWHVDRDVATWQPGPDVVTRQKDLEMNRVAWGAALWDIDPFEPLVPVLLRHDPYNSSKGIRARGFEFQHRLVGAKLALVGREIIVLLPGDANAKKINERR